MRGHTDAARAYRQLRDLIISTELAPGTPLFEADLLERIGVGRTPLRDALQHLAHDRLVEIRPRRGTFVAEVTIGDLVQVFDVVWSLDELLARLVVERCSDADLVELTRLVDNLSAGRAEDTTSTDCDNALEGVLVRVAGNQLLADVYRRCQDTSRRLHYVTRCEPESLVERRDFLRAVADAVAERDAARLTELLRGRRRRFRERIVDSIFSPNGRHRPPVAGPSIAAPSARVTPDRAPTLGEPCDRMAV